MQYKQLSQVANIALIGFFWLNEIVAIAFADPSKFVAGFWHFKHFRFLPSFLWLNGWFLKFSELNLACTLER